MDSAADHPGVLTLDAGWSAASCPADEHEDPAALDGLDWLPAAVPGTVAGALSAAGRSWGPDELDGRDWWFRTTFAAPGASAGGGAEQGGVDAGSADGTVDDAGPTVLRLDGLATVADVFLNGDRIAESRTMFVPLAIDVAGRLRAENVLAIRFRALDPLLRVRRNPRARWRTRVAKDGNLRWFRTTLQGRAPGFSTGPAPVGPWRPVTLEHGPAPRVVSRTLRPSTVGTDGVLDVRLTLAGTGRRRDALGGAARVAPPATVAEVVLDGPSGEHRAALAVDGDGLRGTLTVPDVARWWPHTHGAPVLHDVRLELQGGPGAAPTVLPLGRVGFRDLAPGPSADHDVLEQGLDLHVNGVRVFARGTVWTSVDPVGLQPTDEALRVALRQAADAGINLLRIAGIGVYESTRFHELCDELGIMVWQDLVLANMDYPASDDGFRAELEAEVAALADRIGGRPSTVVVCGNSEVEQQVEMLGLDPGLGRGPLFGELVPRWLRDADLTVPYVPSAPSGGVPAFRPDTGIANYHAIGGYRRPLSDVRRAGVRFSAENTSFANVPDDESLAALLPDAPGDLRVHHPAWKAGVPRDGGSGWDFDDVRDHYLRALYGVDPLELRAVDHERYLELSRSVSGEVMAEVFGEWRRAASPCGGGLVLWHRDLVPGAGWGVVDHTGRAKVALHHLRRAFAPVAVWFTDEGLNGLTVHVANDRPEPLRTRLRVDLLQDGERPVADGAEELVVPPHTTIERSVDALVGRFVDSAWTFRFGPPPHDVVVASLEPEGGPGPPPDGADDAFDVPAPTAPGRVAVAFPAGRPTGRRAADDLGLVVRIVETEEGGPAVLLRSRAFVHGVRLEVPGHLPADDAFPLAPGAPRTVALRPDPSAGHSAPAPPPSGGLRALNLRGRVPIRPRPS